MVTAGKGVRTRVRPVAPVPVLFPWLQVPCTADDRVLLCPPVATAWHLAWW